MDNTCKDDDDFKKIRSSIFHKVKSDEFSILFPLSYLLACLELQTYSRPFIRRSEFLKAVSQYGLKEMDIDHCLRFLHDRVGVLRFFPFGDLKDVIVKDPQALFNIVTNLIIQSFISSGPTMAECDEVERGIYSRDSFDSSILYKSDDVVITLDEVILLLKELRIVAPFHDRRAKVDKFFIPCVLNHLGPSERSPVSSKDISPLGILFKCRRVPKGINGVLVHYILTHEEGETKFWNLDIERIFKDEVSFEVGPYDDLLTLRFFSTHLVVTYVPNNRSKEYSVRAVYHRVQSTLKEGVDKARAILHYSKEKTSYSLGLECDKCKLFHEVAKGKDHHIVKCPHGSYPLSYDGPWDFGGKNAGGDIMRFKYVFLVHAAPSHCFPDGHEVCVKEGSDHVLVFSKEHSSSHSLSREGWDPLLEDHICIRGKSVCFRRVKRRDAGRYTITSSNAYGEGQASFHLRVKCESPSSLTVTHIQ